MMDTRDVELHESVYRMLRDSVPPDVPWLRILLLEERMSGSRGDVLSDGTQVIAWDAETQQAQRKFFDIPTRAWAEVQQYFRQSFDVENWVRVYATCELDGRNWATVVIDPAGPPESDYVSGFDDPFWNYVDEHRAELEELGRRYYGSPRRGLFRR